MARGGVQLGPGPKGDLAVEIRGCAAGKHQAAPSRPAALTKGTATPSTGSSPFSCSTAVQPEQRAEHRRSCRWPPEARQAKRRPALMAWRRGLCSGWKTCGASETGVLRSWKHRRYDHLMRRRNYLRPSPLSGFSGRQDAGSMRPNRNRLATC
jgi:hypothetical protein